MNKDEMKQFLMFYEDDTNFAYIISRNVTTIKESCISLKIYQKVFFQLRISLFLNSFHSLMP